MMRDRLRRASRGQPGFTVIEVIVALAITSIIGLGATMITGQVLTQSGTNRDYTTASRHTMNAIYWISRDAQMSQDRTLGGASGFPLTLVWTEWDNSQHQVTYSIEDDRLTRSSTVDGGEPVETLVAQYVNSVSENTTCAFSDRVLTVKVTATVGNGTHALSVTKVREITPRPGL